MVSLKLRKKNYSVSLDGKNVYVNFKISELPNDMKMLAFLSGELSNRAKFFSSVADVSTETAKNSSGSFGKEPTNLWKPWTYATATAK